IPFKWYPPERILDHMLACRLFDVTEAAGATIDLVIGLRFPAYLIPHPRKVLWILHQHRAAYDLWGHPSENMDAYPGAAQVRESIQRADRAFIPQAEKVFANSRNVADRLRKYCGLESTPLYHPPPGAEEFYCAEPEEYLYFPSRLCQAKRQTLVIEALAQTKRPVRVRFSGSPEIPAYADDLAAFARRHGVERRVEWLGQLTEGQKRDAYARALGVVYPPLDEDYGYVTLEAMLASKPVIVSRDSGGPLEFVREGETGIVADPTLEALAAGMDELWGDREGARRMGEGGRRAYDELRITWPHVVSQLIS
ncbi:MAG TPA: glycosyltransferase family 4 protein, partial [Pyrinomonadaceae bacterium]|nr:glycosyltransferase family 4 protein [Pyrinomonadaceae bacterium]